MSGLWLFLLILAYTLTCLFVILTVLLQSGKGGGLSSLGSGAGGALSDSLGATGAEKTLIKATAWASGIFLALSLVLTLYGTRLEKTGGLSLGAPAETTQQQTTPAPAEAPATAPTAPVNEPMPIQGEKVQPAPAAGQPAAAAETKPSGNSAATTPKTDSEASEPPAAPANDQ